jgi:hypothetical protein
MSCALELLEISVTVASAGMIATFSEIRTRKGRQGAWLASQIEKDARGHSILAPEDFLMRVIESSRGPGGSFRSRLFG